MQPTEDRSLRGPKANEGRMMALRIWHVLCRMYYRYTLEIGIAVLEWWEAVLVNLYFLLLAYSLVKHAVRNGAYILKLLGGFLAFLRNKFAIVQIRSEL